ncbi:MAG: hypothetical protein HBSAPP03_24650 [Phycisphaerae bacterium]|nr:MAG: hypothetical protein HBSAPP03_24650 [Phycisphaerae bacterium]
MKGDDERHDDSTVTPSKPKVILVCDDEAPIRQIIAHKLRAAGHVVHEARNGQEGFDAVAIHGVAPDLILSDYQMPMMSGLEMCARLKTLPQTSAVPVLMLTARGYILDAHDVARTNIRAVIAKPFGVKMLLDRVEDLLGNPPPASKAA